MQAIYQRAFDLSKKYNKPIINNETCCLCRSNPYDMTLEFMEEHITDDYMLEQLAKEMNLTKDYIGKLFRSKTEHTLGECQTQMKVEYAKELLRTTNMKIYEISDKLGYSTVDYFSKIFKKHSGETPAQYRKKDR